MVQKIDKNDPKKGVQKRQKNVKKRQKMTKKGGSKNGQKCQKIVFFKGVKKWPKMPKNRVF